MSLAAWMGSSFLLLAAAGCSLMTATRPQVEVQSVVLRGVGLLEQALDVVTCIPTPRIKHSQAAETHEATTKFHRTAAEHLAKAGAFRVGTRPLREGPQSVAASAREILQTRRGKLTPQGARRLPAVSDGGGKGWLHAASQTTLEAAPHHKTSIGRRIGSGWTDAAGPLSQSWIVGVDSRHRA